jgi:hypothetical protein
MTARAPGHLAVYVALLDWLREHGPTSSQVLYEKFGTWPVTQSGQKQLQRRLDYLVDHGQIQSSLERQRATFYLVPNARPLAALAAAQLDNPPEPLQKVPPRQVNLFALPHYVPPAPAQVRAGANDFTRVASRGWC